MKTLTDKEIFNSQVCGLPRAYNVIAVTLEYAAGLRTQGEYASYYISWSSHEQKKANNLISGIKTAFILEKKN